MNLRGLVLPAAVILLAEALGHLHPVDSDVIALPSQALRAGVHLLLDGSLLARTAETVLATAGGLAVGFLLGSAAGTLLGLFRTLNELMEVSVESLRPVPAIALLPVALLAFGFGYRMEIFIVAFATFWPALILARGAFQDVERQLLDLAAVLRLPLALRIWKIFLPAAAPRILVSFRLCLAIALVVAVTVEVALNTVGLGHAMMDAMQSLHPAAMLAYLVWIGLLGYALDGLTDLILRHLPIHAVVAP